MSRAKRDVHGFKNIIQIMRPQSCDKNLLNCEFLVLNDIIFVVVSRVCGYDSPSCTRWHFSFTSFRVVYDFFVRLIYIVLGRNRRVNIQYKSLQTAVSNNQLTYTGPLLSVSSDHSCSFSWPRQRC